MAIISNLTIDQGSTFSVDIDVTDADGDALNLTSYNASGNVRGQMRKTYTSSTKTDFTCSITNESGGVVNIQLSPTQTNALKAGRYVYDVEIEHNSTNAVTRIVEGQIEVTPGVTR